MNHKALMLVLLALLVGQVASEDVHYDPDMPSHYHPINSRQFWTSVMYAILLCCVAGFCSGNTVGLLSISTLDLQMQIRDGTPGQKKQAETILKVVSNHHLLMSTLLLANALAMTTLPIVMHSLVPAWAAILLSTVVVLIAGEIIPQALCTGPNKMRIAQICSPIVGILIKILWIACYPLSKALDWLFGQHSHTRIQKKDLKNLLRIQHETLKRSQMVLLSSILSLREHRLDKFMVPLKDVYMLNAGSIVSDALIAQVKANDHSFIPVYRQKRSNIIGVIKTKQLTLACFDPANYGKSLSKTIKIDQDILSLYQDTNLLDILMLFENKNERVALVVNQKIKNPTLQSIYYSKTDMIYKKESKPEILGIILLSTIFESIAACKIASQSAVQPPASAGNVEMNDLNKALLH